MSPISERVASLVLSQFERLPRKSKPRIHPNGSREWIPMSGIVLALDVNSEREMLKCVAVATGSKCLPVSALPKCNGMILHDSHAEVLALRALNYFLLCEAHAILQGKELPYVSPFVCSRESVTCSGNETTSSGRPFEVRRNVTIWMYSSEAPCGDASMEILMAEKGGNIEPWKTPPNSSGLLHGRGYFSDLGKVRRKPSRADAEPSMSKSCTDKLALKQVLSILSLPASLVFAPTQSAYLSGLIVPATKHSAEGFERAFGSNGRMAGVMSTIRSSDYTFRPFETSRLPPNFELFPYTKPGPGQSASKAGNISALFITNMHEATVDVNETILAGIKQGFSRSAGNPKMSSAVSRKRIWELVVCILENLQMGQSATTGCNSVVADARRAATYGELKSSSLNMGRRATKQSVVKILGDWPPNLGDEDWPLQHAAALM